MVSLIVMDNASYHNTQTEKIPTKSSRKAEMRECLTNHGISFDDSDLKVDLMEKIKDAKPTKQFENDLLGEACQIFNMDETGMPLDGGHVKIVGD